MSVQDLVCVQTFVEAPRNVKVACRKCSTYLPTFSTGVPWPSVKYHTYKPMTKAMNDSTSRRQWFEEGVYTKHTGVRACARISAGSVADSKQCRRFEFLSCAKVRRLPVGW